MEIHEHDDKSLWARELLTFAVSNQIDSLLGIEKNPQQFFLDLKTLDLSNKELYSLPEAFKHLVYLEHLNLSHNKFEIFPRQVLSLKSLTSLDISWNHIMEIPNSLPQRLAIHSAWNRSKSNR